MGAEPFNTTLTLKPSLCRTVPILISRRQEMWRNRNLSKNLFKTSQATRLASIERSLDTSLLSAQRIPTNPGDIIQCGKDLSDLRIKNGERTRDMQAERLKWGKPTRRYGMETSGKVYGRGERADAESMWRVWDTGAPISSPSDITEWLPNLGARESPFVDS